MLLQLQSHSLLSFNFNRSQILTKIHPASLSRIPIHHSSHKLKHLATVKSTFFAVDGRINSTHSDFDKSRAFAAFFSVAVISIPTLIAVGRLGASAKKLSNVVSEEVPGTLASLKLSSLELKDLTQQLSSLRHLVSGVGIGKKDGSTIRSRYFR